MPVTLTIKQVPDHLAENLRVQAAKNHRSLQGELMSIIERATLANNAGQGSQWMPAAVMESAANYQGQMERPAVSPAETDSLLDELDAIVAGSQWGEAPILTRAQVHDRALARELHYQADASTAK